MLNQALKGQYECDTLVSTVRCVKANLQQITVDLNITDMLITVTGYVTESNTGYIGTKSLLSTPTRMQSEQFGGARSYATNHIVADAQCFHTSGTPHTTGHHNTSIKFRLSLLLIQHHADP
jgi:hypothetical protein